jgi:autotransporter-associated beta strand protein
MLFTLCVVYAPQAWATNECGTGTTVVCNNSGTPASNLNPYANGVAYSTPNINLTLAAGAQVNVTAVQNGPYAAGFGSVLTGVASYGNVVLNVQSGASVTTTTGYGVGGNSGSVAGDSVAITNGGDVTVTGLAGHGLYAFAASNASIVNTGTVKATGTATSVNGIQAQSNDGGTVTVNNSGTITSAAGNGVNVTVNNGGAINLVQTGDVSGGNYGIGLSGGTGSVVTTVTANNGGSVRGTNGAGVQLVRTTGTLTNTGTIQSQNTGGIVLGVGTQMAITNEAAGSITGANGLLTFAGGSTFTNRGTLTGTNGTAILLNGGAITNTTLIFDTGSNVTGNVQGNSVANANNRFILEGSGSYAGNVAGMSTVSMAGTDWLLSGNVTPIDNVAGAVHAQTGRLTITGLLSTSGAAANVLIDNGATVQIGNSGTIGAVAGAITDNGTLAFNRSDAVTYGGIISGTGSVSQLGAGTTTFTGNQAYTGGTLISAGTLQLGNGGTGGSIVGDVTNHGALSINRSDTVTLPGLISGSGRLVQAGTGTTILTANNTYTGGTTITAGTLQLGSGTGGGDVAGNVVNQGILIFNRSDSRTFAGLISGGGAVEQRGSGTTTLTADQTYTGGTTISGGTLQLGDGGTTGNVTGPIVDNGVLAVNHSNSVFFLSPITGTGALAQLGSGTTVLSATNTYTGGTTIQNGTLRVGNGSTSGSIIGDVDNAGMLTFDRSNTLTFDGTISGPGAVTKQNSGITILTADNTYTGGTTITSGSLQLGNGGTSGSIVGDVLDNSALAVNRSDTITLPGTISGSGGLSQRGTGTTVLTANNTYSGGTLISAGTLQLGAGGTSGNIVGDVTDNGTLAFNRADDVTFSNIISGAGGVNQLGPGRLQVNGDQTYTGPTQVLAGTLALAGSLQSTVTVSPGATLSGTGVVNGDVLNQGRLWPGSAIAGSTAYGDFTVHGNYVGQNGVLELNTFLGGDGSPSDRLVIDGGTGSGSTSIVVHNTSTSGAETAADGILLVSAINGATTAGDAFNLPGELRSGALDYRLFRGSKDGALPDNWYLRNDFVVPPPEPPEPPIPPPEPPNPPDPDLPSDPPPDTLPPGDYPIIGPELATYGAIQPLARELGQRTLSTLHDRNGDSALMASSVAATDNSPSSWARVFAATVDQSYKAFAAPQSKGNLAGFQIGGDMWQGQWAQGHTDRFGGYLAYANASVDVRGLVTNAAATGYERQRTGSVGLHATSVGAYWTHYGPTEWYLDGVVQASSYGGTANTPFSHLEPDGTGFLASLEFGYPIDISSMGKGFVLEPQLQAIRQYVNFNARNDGLGMVKVGSTFGSTGRIGLRGKWEVRGLNGELWMPYATVDLIRDWGARSSTVFGDGGGEASVVPLRPQASRGSLTGGVTVVWSPRLMAFASAGYEHELGSGENSRRQGFDANVGLRYMW